jgi:hypothetical protein
MPNLFHHSNKNKNQSMILTMLSSLLASIILLHRTHPNCDSTAAGTSTSTIIVHTHYNRA